MKILSLILGIYAIINLVLIILSINEKITDKYLIFGLCYALVHLAYQWIMKEGIFYYI